MPVLKNARHEKFAQALAKGKTAEKAYVESGYKANRHNAAALAREQHISTRVQEFQMKAAEKAGVTLQSLTDELEEARAIAIAEKQSSAAVAATLGKAKLHGLLIDKKQHAGANGGPIQIADITRLKGMTTEELEVLERALVQIGLAEGDPAGEGEPED
ncbi:terminase [Rhizobium sp. CFBP 8762]|uniref:terminase n=1 Tax=Rhizobium sp. CFBP 8762 TaxID=2775279 RepID=UPI0017840E71|nr:terminase [Rhizobium sp. CFBP 8762]MBD8556310.1 terminase [Rhizobium sp. CFBP 8762]